MSAFSCPHATRYLSRAALQGISPRASASTTMSAAPSAAALRWLSRGALGGGSVPSCLRFRGTWAAPRTKGAATASTTAGQGLGGRRTFFSPKVVRNYEELPRDYRDQAGLAFGSGDLSQEEATKVFGQGMTATAANHLLRILHGRRVAGTLDDPAFQVHTAQFTDAQMGKALAYLRRQVPVEEVRNAGLRAEDELSQMEMEMEQKQQRAAESKDDKAGEESPGQEYKPDPVYGRSKFDEIRARNIARGKARERALEEERKEREAREGAAAAGPLAKQEKRQGREITNPRVAEYYKAAQSELAEPPQLKAWERILPSATVVALVVGFMAAVAMVYEEPAPRYRILRELTTSQATVATLIAVNAAAFIGWRVPPLWSLFNRYMIFVVATVRPVTLFTAVFSHTKLSHLLINMVPLWFVGGAVHDEVGRAGFLALYLGCGAAGFLGSLVTYTLRGWLTVTSLGASGATLGLCSAYFWEHRNDGFRILGLPQDGVHGIVFLAMITALQLAGLGRTARLKVDIASHLSGIAAGILGIEMLNRGRRRRAEERKGDGAIELVKDRDGKMKR